MNMVDSFEKIPVEIFSTSQEGSAFVAAEIAHQIREKQQKNESCVLGLLPAQHPSVCIRNWCDCTAKKD